MMSISIKVHPRPSELRLERERGERGVDHEETSALPPSSRGGLISWIRSHPWITAALLFIIAAVVIVAVVVPVCVVSGCPRKADMAAVEPELAPGAPRLLLSYLNKSVNALDLIPPLLQQYVTNLILSSSDIQILNFDTESVLQEALKYIKGQDLSFLTRDFNMSTIPPNVTNPISSLLDAASSASGDSALQNIFTQLNIAAAGGKRSLQQSDPTVNDPFYVNGSQYYVDLINATGSWKYTPGASALIVAIIDTGADLDHPDLKPNLWVNRGEIPGNGIDDDKNGYIDDVYGYSFAGQCNGYDTITGSCNRCNGTSMPYADSSVDPASFHGTHVAGLVGAAQNNLQGITGIAPGVKLMILRVSDCVGGNMASSDVFKAFDYALRMGAHIVSCSFTPSDYSYGSYPLNPAPSYMLARTSAYTLAMQPMADKGMLAVVASGNDNIDLDNFNLRGYSFCPCLVKLENVLCVGATDATNQRAYFSNFGRQTVHVGAPGMQIYSTLYQNSSGVVSHTYGPLNGTSMATPIVSGTAAITLSLLGASDGNYYKGALAKALLMGSAFLPLVPLPWLSQSRVNTGLSAWLATNQLKSVLVSVNPMYSVAPPASVSFPGLTETYHATTGNLFLNTIVGPPIDVSLRNVSSPAYPTNLTAFKYNTGVIVRLTALLRLNMTGMWGLQVQTTASSLSTWVFINGQQVPLNSTTQIGLFNAQGAGWFNFELRIAFPMANVRYNLLFLPPKATSYASYYDFLTGAPSSTFIMPDYVQNARLSSLWQVFYNKVNTTATPIGFSSVATATPSAQYQYTTTLLDPAQAGQLGQLFFPGDAALSSSATAAVGFMQAFLMPGSWTAPALSFIVTCAGCQLMIDGVVVVDVFEPILTGLPITKNSPCITLTTTSPHQLVIRFALRPISSATMMLRYSSCNAGVAGPYQFLNSMVYNPLVWQPKVAADSLGSAAYIGGLQCDVYRNATGNQTLSFSAQQSVPRYKFRLPTCTDGSDVNLDGTCSTGWKFLLKTFLSGLAGTPAGVTFGVRCWTTWNRGFDAGVIQVLPSQAQGTAYLAGMQIFGSTPAGSSPPLAPSTTLLASDTYQLLVVDWFNVSTTDTISVTNNGAVLQINLTSMRLPIGGLAGSSGNDLMNKSSVVKNYGAYSATVYPDPDDLPGIVTNDLSRAYTLMGSPLPMAYSSATGLNVAYRYARILGNNIRYTQAEGYLFTYVVGLQTIQVGDTNASVTQITLGNVTVRNAPVFGSSIPPSSGSFQIYSPVYVNIYANVICKTRSRDGLTYFNISTVGDNLGPWDSYQWATTGNAKLQAK